MAERAGIIPVAQAHGIPVARARACLTDAAAQARIAQIYQGAIDAGVPGTPYFLINGKQAPMLGLEDASTGASEGGRIR